jgi:hypothetical protein
VRQETNPAEGEASEIQPIVDAGSHDQSFSWVGKDSRHV